MARAVTVFPPHPQAADDVVRWMAARAAYVWPEDRVLIRRKANTRPLSSDLQDHEFFQVLRQTSWAGVMPHVANRGSSGSRFSASGERPRLAAMNAPPDPSALWGPCRGSPGGEAGSLPVTAFAQLGALA